MSDNLPAVAEHHHTIGDIEVMAKHVARSGLFKLNESQAFALMVIAQAKGMHPITAMERYHVIDGKPSMKADAMLADFQAHGGRVEWKQWGTERCEAVFHHPRHAPDGILVTFTIQDAQRAGLTKNPTWQRYPANMLRARVISNGIRMVMPGILSGLYTPEEVGDFDPPPPPKPVVEIGRDETDDPATQPSYETWNDFARRVVSEANAAWDREQAHAEIPPDDRRELLNVYQLCNAVVKRAMAADPPLMTLSELADYMTPGGNHNSTARRAIADLWERHPRRVAATVERYVQAELEAARACLYESESDPDEAASETVETASREPGSDG